MDHILRAAVYTLGCKLNQCESEGLADAFFRQGFTVVKPSDPADIYIVNTCTVTSKAEQKARRMIRRFALQPHRPLVIVTGCYAQMEPELLAETADRLIIVPLERKAHLLALPSYISTMLTSGRPLAEAVEAFVTDDQLLDADSSPFAYEAVTFMYHARAFLKIEDGCDNSCSYCRVTLARGAAVSLPFDQVLERSLEIVRRGYREIVLTGVNITAYRDAGLDLGGLLELLLRRLPEHVRLRLSSLEPDAITPQLIALAADPRIQPHFHIPLQSASPSVLGTAGRSADIEAMAEAIAALKAAKDDPFLAADIITGLPGEREADDLLTREFVEQLGFSQLHIFPYSPRPGTPLYGAGGHVPEYLRDERSGRLRKISAELFSSYRDRQIGRQAEAVVEQVGGGVLRGVTGNYLKVEIAGLTPDPALRGELISGIIEAGREPGQLILRSEELKVPQG